MWITQVTRNQTWTMPGHQDRIGQGSCSETWGTSSAHHPLCRLPVRYSTLTDHDWPISCCQESQSTTGNTPEFWRWFAAPGSSGLLPVLIGNLSGQHGQSSHPRSPKVTVLGSHLQLRSAWATWEIAPSGGLEISVTEKNISGGFNPPPVRWPNNKWLWYNMHIYIYVFIYLISKYSIFIQL